MKSGNVTPIVSRSLAVVCACAASLLWTPASADLYYLQVVPNSNGVVSPDVAYGIASTNNIAGYTSAGVAFVSDTTAVGTFNYGTGPFGTYFACASVNSSGHIVGTTTTAQGVQWGLLQKSPNVNAVTIPSPCGGLNPNAIGDCDDTLDPNTDPGYCGWGADGSGNFQAWAYLYQSYIFPLGNFPPKTPGPPVTSYALSLTNDYGPINHLQAGVVGYVTNTVNTSSGFEGFFWEAGTQQTIPAGTLPGGTFSVLDGIDLPHTISCGYADDATGSTRAALFDFVNVQLTALPPLAGAQSQDYATGVNSARRTVGYGPDPTGTFVAIVWPNATSAVNLNDISAPTIPGLFVEAAFDINENGCIAAGGYETAANQLVAVRLCPVGPTSLQVLTKKLHHGHTYNARFHLNMAAPADCAVTLSSDSPGITFPTNPVVVPNGKTVLTFKFSIAPNFVNGMATITASNTGLSASQKIKWK